ncbi:MAG: hypothetical protein P8R00_06490 [Candidatus Poseidoniaceae archaeon]|jgi:hypothetical protein|nr:hypothetical protein [Euryarchaeota archaeon]MDG1555876.1 hypothetical protein [Candidatus Poseidoniaceae archaeon]MBT5454464.1 hypothetical protein [Euryarchaeota archaeon]MBT6255343.1 hypothetical protein [Euryarchaeota archaeon]MBT6527777.1 hypothetical protein [Euryarchaeota archaeon]
MESYRPALERWCEHEWGQLPQAISEWHADEDMAQVFMRLNRSVLIADFVVENDGSLECKEHLQIPLDRWNPGSIQAFRTADGRVRFRHRQLEIHLAARLRAPEWGQALLEEWLMSQRGDVLRPKDRTQRIASINRTKMSIERNLNHSNLDAVRMDFLATSASLGSVERNLDSRVRSDESE